MAAEVSSLSARMRRRGSPQHPLQLVALVGGSTRIPKVQQLLKEYFGGKEPRALAMSSPSSSPATLSLLSASPRCKSRDSYASTCTHPHVSAVLPSLIATIQVFEGERLLTNNHLGKFELTSVPPLPVMFLKSWSPSRLTPMVS